MKKSTVLMMVVVMILSLNLFAECPTQKGAKHVCTTECNHKEFKKEIKCDLAKQDCSKEKMAQLCNSYLWHSLP